MAEVDYSHQFMIDGGGMTLRLNCDCGERTTIDWLTHTGAAIYPTVEPDGYGGNGLATCEFCGKQFTVPEKHPVDEVKILTDDLSALHR